MFPSYARKFLVMSCILSLFAVLLGFNSHLSYGQQTNSAGNATSLNYNGTDFSLRYPASWTVVPFEKAKNGETFVAAKFQPHALIVASITSTDPDLMHNVTQKETESNLHQIFDFLAKNFVPGIFTGTLTGIDELNYIKCAINGHKAGSTVITGTLDGLDQKGLLLATIAGEKIFFLSYLSTPETFGQNLPIVENVIKSVKFK